MNKTLIIFLVLISFDSRKHVTDQLDMGGTLGWGRHVTGQYPSDLTTWDDFKSVAVIPGRSAKANGDTRLDDEVWVIVERTIDSNTVKYVEQVQALDWGSDPNYCWFVDAGIGDANSYGIAEVPEVPGNVYTEYFVGTFFDFPITYDILVNATIESEIDTSWGSNGFFGFERPAGGQGTTIPRDILQLTDGRTLVPVPNFIIGSDTYSAVMVNTDGTLDTTWGTGGFFVLPTASAFWQFQKVLQDNDGSFHFLGARGGVSFSGYVKVDANGIFEYTSPSSQYEAFGFVDATWSDSSKTRILAIKQTDSAIWTGSEFVIANIMAIDPETGERDETWPGNVGYAGFADFGGGYYVTLLSDGDFVTFQNGSPTMQKFLADGSALDTTWGTNGTLDIGDFPFETTFQRITTGGDIIYTITVNTIDGDINNTISKIDSTGTVIASVDKVTFSNAVYQCIEVINDQLIIGTNGGATTNNNIEFWSQDLVFESGFNISGLDLIFRILPDETSWIVTVPAVPGVDVNWVELEHLPGADVCVYADGRPLGVFTVTEDANGSNVIDLEDTFDVVIAGINYYSIYETFPLMAYAEMRGMKAQVYDMKLDFHETMGCNHGVDLTNTSTIQFSDDNFATAIDPYTGWKYVTFPRGITREPIIYLWIWEPIPLTVRGLYPRANIYED